MCSSTLIQAMWKDSLLRMPPLILKGWELPHETFIFLTTCGLPQLPIIDRYSGMEVIFSPLHIRAVPYQSRQLAAIGELRYDDAVQLLCIDPPRGDVQLIEVEPEPNLNAIFANSSVEALLLFLGIWRANVDQRHALVTEMEKVSMTPSIHSTERLARYRVIKGELNALINGIREQFLTNDSKALEGVENFWPMLLGDV